jgi:phosphoribosyl-ATP pyrophosphohydrolase/phosphoribosyl-AMP cyclohydrolase
MKKLIIPQIYLKNGQANGEDAVALAKKFSNEGADGILLFDLSSEDVEHDINLHTMKEIYRAVEVPLYGAGNIKREEDVKKILYTGCSKAILNFSKESAKDLLAQVSKRFGQDKIGVSILAANQMAESKDALQEFASMIVAVAPLLQNDYEESPLPVLATIAEDSEKLWDVLRTEQVFGITGNILSNTDTNFMQLKRTGTALGIDMDILKSNLSWSQMKLNADGMVPVIVQDYRTDEVLMLAYMTEEAFEKTLETGLMTYYSRSRNCLWTKGLTSGHVQYVKSLTADCDYDTILAKVSQVGPACHTGKPSCFFNTMLKKDYKESNPRKVFEHVYGTIMDRKLHPKEGSYTNYLFDKGIDKILKKVGEEATEIIIAAKNPEPEEIKYEMADFLYHAMVLMAEKGITWDEIIEELDNRH